MYNSNSRLTSTLRISLVTAALALLAACGFHLRGNVTIAPELHHISLKGKSNADFSELLQQRFSLYDIDLSDGSDYTIVLEDYDEDSRSVGYDSQARTSEYELTIDTDFRLIDKTGLVIIPTRNLYALKNYNSNPNNAIASDNEEELIWEELRTQIANALLNQLATIDAAKLQALQQAAEQQRLEDQKKTMPPANPNDPADL